MIFFLACTTPKTDTATPNLEGERLVIATAALDYAVGSLAQIDIQSMELYDDISSISGDGVVVFDQYLWQLNRYQYDTIRKYDTNDLRVPLQVCTTRPNARIFPLPRGP